MKVFTFRYDKKEAASAGRRMEQAARTGSPDVRDHELVCDSVATLLKLASTPKFEIFDVIVARRPQSLYEVARILGKDQGQVLKDTRSLEALGLVRLIAVKDGGRERLRPEAVYEKVIFELRPRRSAESA